MKSDKTTKKLYDELIDTIKSNTETEWQEKRIMTVLLNYLNAINK